MSDERKQEITSALQDGFYRYTLERGAVEVGFADGTSHASPFPCTAA